MFKKLSHWENKKHVRTNDGDYVCWSAFYRWKSVVNETDPMLKLLQPQLGTVNRVRYVIRNNSILLYSRGWLRSRVTQEYHFSVQLWPMKDWTPDGWINTHRRISETSKLCLRSLWGRIMVKIQQLTLEQIASWKPGHISIVKQEIGTQVLQVLTYMQIPNNLIGRAYQHSWDMAYKKRTDLDTPWTNPSKVIESSRMKSEERLTKQPVFVRYLFQNPSPAKTT